MSECLHLISRDYFHSSVWGAQTENKTTRRIRCSFWNLIQNGGQFLFSSRLFRQIYEGMFCFVVSNIELLIIILDT